MTSLITLVKTDACTPARICWCITLGFLGREEENPYNLVFDTRIIKSKNMSLWSEVGLPFKSLLTVPACLTIEFSYIKEVLFVVDLEYT